MLTSRLRAGIVGPGFIGGVHAAAVRAAGGTVAAVVGSSPLGTERGARQLGAERGEPSVEALAAADDIDVVHICTPNSTHAALTEVVLAAGKAVVCEKPLATSAADARAVTEQAAARDLVAAVPFVYRFYPSVREARARIATGDAGALWLLHGSYLQDWLAGADLTNWRVDPLLGGVSRAFADIGVHWCDLMEFTTGHRITRLSATLGSAFAHRRGADGDGRVPAVTEDGAVVTFETDLGAIGSLVVSQVSPGRKNRLWFSFDGSAQSYSFDQEVPDSLWVGARAENRVLMRGPDSFGSAAEAYSCLPAGHPQGYQDAFTAFVSDVYAALRGHAPDGLPTFADGLRAAYLTEAVVASAAGRTWVDVPSPADVADTALVQQR